MVRSESGGSVGQETESITGNESNDVCNRSNSSLNWQRGQVYRTSDGRYVLIESVHDVIYGHVVKDPDNIAVKEIYKSALTWNLCGNNINRDHGLDFVERLVNDSYGTGYLKY